MAWARASEARREMVREGAPEGGPRGVPVGEVEGDMKGRPRPAVKEAARMVHRGEFLAERGRSGAIGDPGAPNFLLTAPIVLPGDSVYIVGFVKY